ncbi:hypothetical protein MAR_005464 [Mya arenaria]|uniref:PH domain-containing protein n=1 Tax=Mya arenaria TaxID=6604 RepID=A0ABY7F1W5_MYAAR|nr:hypothetical protein MAR_005464 [Mya arenaria]
MAAKGVQNSLKNISGEDANKNILKNISAQSLVTVIPKCLHEKLRKRNKFRALFGLKWSQKFVVLARACLYIYGDEMSTNYEDAFSMADFKCVNRHTKGDQYFYLTFNDPDKEHIIFSCDTNKSRKKWMKRLKEAIDEATDSGIGHDVEDEAEQSDDEDSDDEEHPSAMAAAKRPNTYFKINDSDVLQAGDCTTLNDNHGEEPQYENVSQNHSGARQLSRHVGAVTKQDKPRFADQLPKDQLVTGRDKLRSADPLPHDQPVTSRDKPQFSDPLQPDQPGTRQNKQPSAVPLSKDQPVTRQNKPRSADPLQQVQPVTRQDKQPSAIPKQTSAVYPRHHTPKGKPTKKEPLRTNAKMDKRDDMDKHLKLKPTENRNSSSSTSSSDSDAFLCVSVRGPPVVTYKTKSGSQSMMAQSKASHRPHKSSITFEKSLTHKQCTFVSGVQADDQTSTFKMERANEVKDDGPDVTDENCYENTSNISEFSKSDRTDTDAKIDDKARQPIISNSSSASEAQTENALVHVPGRSYSSTALNKKGGSQPIKMRVNIIEHSSKPENTIRKGLPRSYSSSELQDLYVNVEIPGQNSDTTDTDTTN